MDTQHLTSSQAEMDEAVALMEGIGLKKFLADNNGLDSSSPGLGIRRSMSFNDLMGGTKFIPWGNTVSALPIDADWVKLIPEGFLPVKARGVMVLKPQGDQPDIVTSIRSLKDQVVELSFANAQTVAEMQEMRSDRDVARSRVASLQAEVDEAVVMLQDVGLKKFLVDGTELSGTSPGLGIRRSMSFNDLMGGTKFIPWGNTVSAIRVNEDWVKLIPEGFLPVKARGVMVLKPQGDQLDIVTSIRSLKDQVVELSSANAQTMAEMQELRSDRDVARSRLTSLEAEVNETVVMLQEIRSDRDVARSRVASLQAEVNETVVMLQEIRSDRDVASSRVASLQAEMDEAVAMLQDFELKNFLVDNNGLARTSPGLGIRRSMSFNDRMGDEKHIAWGDTVSALLINEDWVKLIPEGFLPVRVNGVKVLEPKESTPGLTAFMIALQGQLAEVKAANAQMAMDLQELQSERDAVMSQNVCLKEWPLNTLYPWRLKETLSPANWQPLDGASSAVMHAACEQNSVTWQHIISMFDNNGKNPHHVRSIVSLHHEDGLKIFEGILSRLEQRRHAGGAFDTDIPDDDPKRQVVIERLKRHFLRQPPSLKFANVMFVWHGGDTNSISGIARNGFADLKKTDDGWFGSGLYSTTDAQYACMYSTGEINSIAPSGSGPWKVVLAAMAMSYAYPVTRTDYAHGQSHSKYKGKPLETGFYAHAVVVNPDDGYQAAQDPDATDFQPMEIVAAQEGQLLPLAVVEFE